MTGKGSPTEGLFGATWRFCIGFAAVSLALFGPTAQRFYPGSMAFLRGLKYEGRSEESREESMKKLAWLSLLLLGLSGGLAARASGPSHVQETFVTNPASGAALFVQVYEPRSGAGSWPALVLVPGGRSAGTRAFRPPVAQRYADLGFWVVVFDPDGRGRSSGTEDDDGFVQQDGLRAVIEYAAGLPGKDGRVVLASFSYGITMATGALARYPDLPVALLIDWEGPADRRDTGGCDADHVGHLRDAGCDNEAFWQEREAATFISEITVPYQRLQSLKDHVQPDNDHAILLINNATNTAFGGAGKSPWTRLNDEAPNRVYGPDTPVTWLPEGVHNDQLVSKYLEAFLRGEIPGR